MLNLPLYIGHLTTYPCATGSAMRSAYRTGRFDTWCSLQMSIWTDLITNKVRFSIISNPVDLKRVICFRYCLWLKLLVER